MAIDFPTSPTTGQLYTLGDRQWRYNGSAWDAVGFGPRMPSASSAPSSPAAGDMYLNTTSGLAYVYNGTAWTVMNQAVFG